MDIGLFILFGKVFLTPPVSKIVFLNTSNYIHISMQRVGHDLATEWHQFKFIWILILLHGMKEKSFPSSQ